MNLIAASNTTDAAQSIDLANRRAAMREFIDQCSPAMLSAIESVSGINQTNEGKDQ